MTHSLFRKKAFTRSLSILAAVTALSGFVTAPAQAQTPEGVTLYQHCNYGGYGVSLPAGSHNFSQLIKKGAKNDDVSSIKVSEGYEIKIFRDANYKGPSKTFNKDVSCLVSHKMNDYLSSVKVTKKVASSPVVTTNCANHHVGLGVNQDLADAGCKAGANHSYITDVLHTDGDFMNSHDINGSNVSAAYFKGGRLEETVQKSKIWKEYDKDRRAVFTFEETHRDEWSVYLKDTSRNVRLQIDVHRKMVRVNEGSGMRDLYPVLHFSEFH